MKNLLTFIAFFCIALSAHAMNAAQEEFDLSAAFLNGAALATTATLAVDALKNLFPVFFQGNVLKITGYLSPIILAFATWKFNIGFLADYQDWWMVLLVGIYCSVVTYFQAYLGILNVILQFFKIDLKNYRKLKRYEAL